jgi:hypothetical protein
MTKEWGELIINWHLEAFGAFYTPFWAAYGKIMLFVFANFGKLLKTRWWRNIFSRRPGR